MTVDEFVSWAMAQPEGRLELVNGAVVAMAQQAGFPLRAIVEDV